MCHRQSGPQFILYSQDKGCDIFAGVPSFLIVVSRDKEGPEGYIVNRILSFLRKRQRIDHSNLFVERYMELTCESFFVDASSGLPPK